MQSLFKRFAIVAVGAAILASSVAPASASSGLFSQVVNPAFVENVQYRPDRDRFWDRREYRHDRRREAYFKGYRGYRDQRPGYRRHSDGWWYPLAAFGAAAAIGNAIVNQSTAERPVHSGRHIEWCSGRFKTYRASDNTYVPRVGYRAQCNSPFRW